MDRKLVSHDPLVLTNTKVREVAAVVVGMEGGYDRLFLSHTI